MLSFAFWIEVFESEGEPLLAEGPLDSMFDLRIGTLISDCWGISPSLGGPSDIADGFSLGGFGEMTKVFANFVCGREEWGLFGAMGSENDENEWVVGWRR